MTESIDTAGMDRLFAKLRRDQIPKAKRNAARDMAFDGRLRMIEEMRRVFDRPTKAVLSVPYVRKDETGADLYLSDYLGGKRGAGPSHAITPHMTGQPATRGRKGMEKRLQAIGRIAAGEWMVPAKGAALDQHGNVKGSQAQKMLADIGAMGQFAGDSSNTNPNARTVRGRKGKARTRRGTKVVYFWVEPKSGAKGIYRKIGGELVPVMIVIRKAPSYAKRYRWEEVIKSYSARRMAYHAGRAVEQVIARGR